MAGNRGCCGRGCCGGGVIDAARWRRVRCHCRLRTITTNRDSHYCYRKALMKTLIIAIVAAGLAAAQIETPVAGIIRDRTGALRPVLGVTGAFIAGDALA